MLSEYQLEAARARQRAAAPRLLVVRNREEAAALRSAAGGDGAWLELSDLDSAALPELASDLAPLLKTGAPIACLAPAGFRCRRALEPVVSWRRARGIGILSPRSPEWPRRHPLSFALLAGLEQVVAGWPLVRGRGRWVLHEGVRR